MAATAFIVGLLVVAVILGRWDAPCHDPQCAANHRRHLADEARQKADEIVRHAHRFHSRDFPQAGCVYCDGGGFER